MHAQTDGPPEDKTILMVLFQYFNYQLAHHPYCSYADGAGAQTPLVTSTQNLYFVPSHTQICIAIQRSFLKAIYG